MRAATCSERRAGSEKGDVEADPDVEAGKAVIAGEESEKSTQRVHRGIGGGTHAQGDRRNTGNPDWWLGRDQPTGRLRGTGRAARGGGGVRTVDRLLHQMVARDESRVSRSHRRPAFVRLSTLLGEPIAPSRRPMVEGRRDWRYERPELVASISPGERFASPGHTVSPRIAT